MVDGPTRDCQTIGAAGAFNMRYPKFILFVQLNGNKYLPPPLAPPPQFGGGEAAFSPLPAGFFI